MTGPVNYNDGAPLELYAGEYDRLEPVLQKALSAKILHWECNQFARVMTRTAAKLTAIPVVLLLATSDAMGVVALMPPELPEYLALCGKVLIGWIALYSVLDFRTLYRLTMSKRKAEHVATAAGIDLSCVVVHFGDRHNTTKKE